MDYAFERVFNGDVHCFDISEFSYKIVYKFGFFFTILYNGMSFILNELFLNYNVYSEKSMILGKMKFWIDFIIVKFYGI